MRWSAAGGAEAGVGAGGGWLEAGWVEPLAAASCAPPAALASAAGGAAAGRTPARAAAEVGAEAGAAVAAPAGAGRAPDSDGALAAEHATSSVLTRRMPARTRFIAETLPAQGRMVDRTSGEPSAARCAV